MLHAHLQPRSARQLSGHHEREGLLQGQIDHYQLDDAIVERERLSGGAAVTLESLGQPGRDLNCCRQLRVVAGLQLRLDRLELLSRFHLAHHSADSAMTLAVMEVPFTRMNGALFEQNMRLTRIRGLCHDETSIDVD